MFIYKSDHHNRVICNPRLAVMDDDLATRTPGQSELKAIIPLYKLVVVRT
jgi:hypothetical protein